MDKLYRTLRELVSPDYKIQISDGSNPKVVINPDEGYKKHPWVSFEGETVQDSLMRAINKFKNPEMDYRAKPTIIDRKGHLWKADEESIYSETHIRLFLNVCDEGGRK